MVGLLNRELLEGSSTSDPLRVDRMIIPWIRDAASAGLV
jgi:hypothetical protein